MYTGKGLTGNFLGMLVWQVSQQHFITVMWIMVMGPSIWEYNTMVEEVDDTVIEYHFPIIDSW